MASQPDLQHGFSFGPFVALPDRNIIRRDGNDVHLEPKQMKALVALARHHPAVVSKQQLVDEVWDGRATSDESITGCIKGLRAALDNDNPRKPQFVETIHGRGYRLMTPPATTAPANRTEPARQWTAPAAVALVLIASIAGYFLLSREPGLAPPSQIDSVVVTRFVNMSSEATQPTVDGITEQLVSTLYEVPNLQIKKGSLPDENDTARDIADRYGVGWVVFGSIQQMDGEVKIIARIDDRDSVVEWAGTFTGTDDEIFELHEQVATKVRDAILGVEEESVTAASKPTSSEAYAKYLLGQFYLAKRDKASLDQAVQFFRDATRIDQGYGPAYLDLANTYMLLADYGNRNELFDLATRTVDEGVRRDPTIYAASRTVHGYVHSKRGNWLAATEAFSVATGSDTEYPPALHYYSRLLAAVGRTDESLHAALRAWEMEPDSQVLNSRLAITYFWQGDMENARRFYDIANRMGSGAPIHQLSYALFLIRDNQIGAAREVTRRAMQEFQADPSWVDAVFDELAKSPTSDTMKTTLDRYAAQNIIPVNVLMTFRALSGQRNEAMAIAWQLVDDASLFDIELLYLDEFRTLRQHEDFSRLTEQLGLNEYWRNVGCRWQSDALQCTPL